MPFDINEYLIEQNGIAWSKVLSSWSWLVPSKFTLWLVSRFADLFLVLDDGTVHMLDVGDGSLTKIAESRDDFCERFDDDDNGNYWLSMPLVDDLIAAGMRLQPRQCYGFKQPPILGGDYKVENCCVVPIADYLETQGVVQEQLRDVPDGTEVEFRLDRKRPIVNLKRPKPPFRK